MKINQDNYEQYFLDHAEGTLSPEMEKELTDFLEVNPDLKPVLEEFDASPLQTVELRNDKLKARLKKHLILTDHISEDNIDIWMIRDIEGLLDESEENELREFLTLNPAYSFDYKIFGFTKLSPDLSVTYRRKKDLKKKYYPIPANRLIWLTTAAAAILLLFFGIRFLSRQETTAKHPSTPAIALTPSLSSPGIVDESKASSIEEKKIRVKNTTAPEPISGTGRGNAYRLKPIPAKEIIPLNSISIASLNLNDFSNSPAETADKKDRSLLSKVFSNMVAQAKEGLNNRPKLDRINKTELNFWSIAKAGINGFNSMSDRELELYVRKDESGKVKSYALVEEERLILSKDLNKN
jgi:hypothetical protein